MFGLGFWEISVILIIALVVLGPKKLPELAKSLGKGIREFRNATEDFKSTMDSELHKPEQQRELPKPQPPAGQTVSSDESEVEAEVEKVTPSDKEEATVAAGDSATKPKTDKESA